VSDSLSKEFENPESAIMIAVIGNEVHVAYSMDLSGDYEEILDILETAAILVATEQQKKSDGIVH
jgi:hypothetical protein